MVAVFRTARFVETVGELGNPVACSQTGPATDKRLSRFPAFNQPAICRMFTTTDHRRSKGVITKNPDSLIVNCKGHAKRRPCLIVDKWPGGFRLRGAISNLRRAQVVEVILGEDLPKSVQCSVVSIGKPGSKQEGEAGYKPFNLGRAEWLARANRPKLAIWDLSREAGRSSATIGGESARYLLHCQNIVVIRFLAQVVIVPDHYSCEIA